MGEAFLMGQIGHVDDVSKWVLVEHSLSNMKWGSEAAKREVSVEVNDEDTFLIVCNCGIGEPGNLSSDPDFVSYASTFLVHKGSVIFGVKQQTTHETWYNSFDNGINRDANGSIITSEATIANKVFLYNQPNLSDEMGYATDRVYTYSVWKLTQ